MDINGHFGICSSAFTEIYTYQISYHVSGEILAPPAWCCQELTWTQWLQSLKQKYIPGGGSVIFAHENVAKHR